MLENRLVFCTLQCGADRRTDGERTCAGEPGPGSGEVAVTTITIEMLQADVAKLVDALA